MPLCPQCLPQEIIAFAEEGILNDPPQKLIYQLSKDPSRTKNSEDFKKTTKGEGETWRERKTKCFIIGTSITISRCLAL